MERGIARANGARYSNTTAGKFAYQLGWFSIALGATELLATRTLTRSLGMRGQETLIRAYGVREIVKGIGILTASDPTPWLWGGLPAMRLTWRRSPMRIRTMPGSATSPSRSRTWRP